MHACKDHRFVGLLLHTAACYLVATKGPIAQSTYLSALTSVNCLTLRFNQQSTQLSSQQMIGANLVAKAPPAAIVSSVAASIASRTAMHLTSLVKAGCGLLSHPARLALTVALIWYCHCRLPYFGCTTVCAHPQPHSSSTYCQDNLGPGTYYWEAKYSD